MERSFSSSPRAHFLAQCSNHAYEPPEMLQAWLATVPDWVFEPENLIVCEETSTYGFLAYNRASGEIVLCFKGSHELTDWLRGLTDAEMIDWHALGSSCRVNAGFIGSWQSVREQVLQRLLGIITQMEPQAEVTLHVTGHSLGGALATLATADMLDALGELPVQRLELYTFGAPVVGDEQFVEMYERLVEGRLNCACHYITPDDPIDALLNDLLSSTAVSWLTDGRYARLHNRIVLPASSYINGHVMENYIALLATTLEHLSDSAPDAA